MGRQFPEQGLIKTQSLLSRQIKLTTRMKVGPDSDPEVREPCFPRAQREIPEPFPFADTQETVESLAAKSRHTQEQVSEAEAR